MKRLVEILSKQDIEKIFEHIHMGVALFDSEGALVSWNPAFEKINKAFDPHIRFADMLPDAEKTVGLEKASHGIIHHWLDEFQADETQGSVLCNCLAIPLSGGRRLIVVERIEAEFSVQEIILKLGRQVKLFRIESEFSKKLAKNKQIEMEAVMTQAREVAHVDPLTVLPNRRTILRALQDEVLRAERYGSMLSASIVDVDHFKGINDTYGHLVGDEALRQVANQLRDHIRQPDVVGRYGGEEFLIILPNSDTNAAAEQADRLCRQVHDTVIRANGHEIKVTLSIGTAQLQIGSDTWDSLLNRADTAMYEAKKRGRNCWVAAD